MIGEVVVQVSPPSPSLPLKGEGDGDFKVVFIGEPNEDAVRMLFEDVLKWSLEHGEEI